MANKRTDPTDGYAGHDEATQKPTNTYGIDLKTPMAAVPLSDTPISVNAKTPSGHKGGDSK